MPARAAEPRAAPANATPDDATNDVDELRDVSPSEAYGFASMCLTAVGFALWLFCLFASDDALERLGAPSGKAAKHYARVFPIWLIAACIYALLGYECLNLMATPADFDERFGQRAADRSEYVLDEADDEHFEPFPKEATHVVPLFRDIAQYEITRRMFKRREFEAAEEEERARRSEETPGRRTRSRSRRAS